MNDPSPPLLQAASAIADGRAVDWQLTDRAVQGSPDRDAVAPLQVVERIATFHREWFDTEQAEPTAPSDRWGHLRLLERLGRGSFGEVYRAFDTQLERQVALKLLRPDRNAPNAEHDRATFVLQEGRRMARVRHANVATVYGADEHDGRVGLWMELVAGKTLRDVLDAQGLLGAREAAAVGLDLCRAVAAVHQAGLLHRDIKAQNVMRESGGRIVLMDFGAGVDSSSTRGSGSPMGTPLYMAPEVLRGEPASHRSDIYSLGVLLYYLVTKSYPVHASQLTELVEMHERGPMRRLRDVRADLPLAFVQVVEQAIAHDPRARFQSAAEMEEALARVLRPPVSRRRKIAMATAAVAVLSALTLLLWPSGYEVKARLCRVVDGKRQVLKAGDRVAVGDRLGVELVSSTQLWVYIVNEDEQGSRHLLFPVDDGRSANPQPAGGTKPRWLPGYRENGDEDAWEIDSVGGKEHFLIVASDQPIDDLAERLKQEKQALPTSGRSQVTARADSRSRGSGARTPGPPSQPSDASTEDRLVNAVEWLTDRAEHVTGIFKLHIELENPGN